MIQSKLNTEQRIMLDSISQFTQDRLAPKSAEIDLTGNFDHELYLEIGELGLLVSWSGWVLVDWLMVLLVG